MEGVSIAVVVPLNELTGIFSIVEGQWDNDVFLGGHVSSQPNRIHSQQLDNHNQNSNHDHNQQQQQQQQHHKSSPLTNSPHNHAALNHDNQSPLIAPLAAPSLPQPFSPSLVLRHLTRHGTIDSPGGSMYVGEVQGVASHGRGTRVFPDGSRYDGEWKGGVRSCSVMLASSKIDFCVCLAAEARSWQRCMARWAMLCRRVERR